VSRPADTEGAGKSDCPRCRFFRRAAIVSGVVLVLALLWGGGA
jgi:hypothetical protein